MKRLPVILLAAAGCLLAADPPPAPVSPPSQPTDEALRAYTELAHSNLQVEKAVLIAANMDFTPDEAAEFWPLHRDYELALNKLLDRRLALVRDYLAEHATLTDETARRMAARLFALEHDRTKLKEVWFKKFIQVVPAHKAARFFQLESQLNAAIDLRLAATVPLIR